MIIFPEYGIAVEWEKKIGNRFQRATKRDKFSRAAWGFDVVLNSRQQSVFIHVASIYANILNQKKAFALEKCPTPRGLVWDTNMAAVSLFWDTNVAAVTSCENTLQEVPEQIISQIYDIASIFTHFCAHVRQLKKFSIDTKFGDLIVQ